MGYEVDFLPVGDGQSSGDAICMRMGDLHSGDRSKQLVMVIDGGTRASGQALVEHIRKYYGTNTVDLVVSTHPDNDHVSGLRDVLEEMDVDQLWMHLPWNHAEDFRALFNRRLTSIGLKRKIRLSLETAVEVEDIARQNGVAIHEPFSDVALPYAGLIDVLGPSSTYYESLLPNFRETPEAASASGGVGLLQRVGSAVVEAVKTVAESWYIETLSDPADDASSAENNSSVILTVNYDGHRLMFTADAGTPALNHAVDTAGLKGIHLPSLRLFQGPHHGSRRNVGPTVLDRILGPKYQEPDNEKVVYISAAKAAEKHPARKVCNALQRRGAKERVYTTEGQTIRHHHDAPDRGWTKLTPKPFYSEVEE